MNLALPLNEMTTEDKLRTMESLWDNLCQNNTELSSPSWHGEILAERDLELAQEKAQVIDWEIPSFVKAFSFCGILHTTE